MITLLVSGVLGVMAMRSCQSTSPSSPSNPANLARQGVAGICANQQSVAAAGSADDVNPTVTLPPDLAPTLANLDPAIAAQVGQAVSCPTDTSAP